MGAGALGVGRGVLRARSFSDLGVYALAAATVAAARWAHPWPLPLPFVLLAGGWAVRRAWLVASGVVVLASLLAAVALAGAAPAASGPFADRVTLLGDPVAEPGGRRVDVRTRDGGHLELHARAAASAALRDALAGQVVAVAGRVEPRPADATWLLWRHVVGRVETTEARVVDDGDPASRVANAARRVLARGADPLPPDERALFTGFVFGDDRDEPATVLDDFRATGLSHLLAVSGENVAFVLVAARPLLRRLGLRGRFVLSLGLLAFFALATRFEPSVLRATAMAVLVSYATLAGRPLGAARALGLAVIALVLLDPFLVAVAGFQLSVAASLGIIVLARPVAARVPGPMWWAELVGVSIAAQAGVAPVLVLWFDRVSLLSLPANLLAVPAAGPVMVWGLTAGFVAGLAGGPAAAVVHLPTHLLLWWVEHVAAVVARAPVGSLGAAHVAAVAGIVGAMAAVSHARSPWAASPAGRRLSRAGALAVFAVLSAAAIDRPAPVGPLEALGPGASLYAAPSGDTVLVVDGRARIDSVLAGLRNRGVHSLGALVVRSDSRGAKELRHALVARLAPALVVEPGPGLEAGAAYAVGDLAVRVVGADPPLRVEVTVTTGAARTR